MFIKTILELIKSKEFNKTANNEMLQTFSDTEYFDTIEEALQDIEKTKNNLKNTHTIKIEYAKELFYHKFTYKREIKTVSHTKTTDVVIIYYEI